MHASARSRMARLARMPRLLAVLAALLLFGPAATVRAEEAPDVRLGSDVVPTFDQVYKEAFGKPPSGPKWDALLLTNHLGTQMQRLIVLPKGSPAEAVSAT